MSLDGAIIDIYTDEIIALSETTRAPARLARPDASARAVSPICGSEVLIELNIADGRITAVGHAIEACAITRAAAAILKIAAIGKNKDDIAAARRAMKTLLDGGAAPSGDFARLGILAAVHAYPARHNALMLPFEAMEKALNRP